MTEQIEPGNPADATASPTVALIDQRLAELDGGPESIGIQEGHIAQAKADLADLELRLAGCLAEKAQLEADRARLVPAVPEPPTEPEETA
ncbi:hypothetical protein GUY44_07370 [Pimelobacter simplex]|uniref:Uncharacterized protein n=1 Tax=Nocardioides simplex TaxID=2045 RepID=A0A0A1DKE9_NOCSI|nr:hypothetical protein [Pimelobacter simplex]AIY15850.1 hypothetical protein KR76_02005 [Pimelobacter simplex]MCG8150293.1 hypothetical protein [Pimelobacter simplex]GEB16658.1 hypothetical protein NSI01_49730 [Pimelobacter simplex]